MLFESDATSLILRLLLIDDAGDPVTGVAFDDGDLSLSYLLEASGAWVTPTLVSGTAGVYLANSWVEIGGGLYQWCPPAAVVVADTTTLIRATYAANDPQYDTIELRLHSTLLASIAAAATGGTFEITLRVAGSTITAYIDDDYRVRSGTELVISVADIGGALHTKLDGIGIANLAFGASRANKAAGEITGTIAAIDYASDVLTISVEITACGTGLRADEYEYQIQSTQEQSGEYDDFVELSGTLILSRRTVVPVG